MMLWLSISLAECTLFSVDRLNSLRDAWSLANNLRGDNATKVQEAMPNAIAVADYASKRVDRIVCIHGRTHDLQC